MKDGISMDSSTISVKLSKKGKTNKNRKKDIGFKAVPFIPPAEREYGLQRVDTVRASTPYPEAHRSTDLSSLRYRLIQEKDNNFANMDSEEKKQQELIHSQLIGTSQTNLNKIVNPKLRMKRSKDRQNIDKGSNHTVRISTFNIRSERSSSSDFLSLGTPHPKKKIVLNAENLVKRLTNASINFPFERARKVTIICPKESDSKSSTTDDSKESFEERRRQFHMGEFTIAKNGKKMSDFTMGQSEKMQAPKYHVDQTYKKVIEEYIQKQGFMKSQHNELTNINISKRSLVSLGSTDAIIDAFRAQKKLS